jgi:hypothetical protein
LGLKTNSFGLMICVSKSPRQFLDLSLKTKWTMVYRLRHKTNGGRTARDTRRDLATLLRLKVSHARVFQSGHKTGGGTTICGARDIITEVVLRES